MIRKLLFGFACGVGVSSYESVSRAVDAPTLAAVLDPTKDSKPIDCVIVGGGYSGSKMAYQFDSIFNVTLIDTKNYFEITSDIIPIIAAPWSEKSEEACKKLQVLHRYYLKRANVLTGRAKTVTESEVILEDGRKVPYNVLVVATGEEKSFPFRSTQKTIGGRVAELKHFNQFLGTLKKVAIVGGGPMGVTLAAELSENRPDLEIHLFHSSAEVMTQSPELVRDYAIQFLKKRPNVVLNLCTHVRSIETSSELNDKATPQRWWSFKKLSDVASPPQAYALAVERLEYEPTIPQSIVSQIYFGRKPQPRSSKVISTETLGEFDYVFNVGGDVPQPVGSTDPTCILRKHEAADGHYRSSTLMQLFGHPNIFVPGRCNNLPWPRGYGSSDLQARTLFRMMNGLINASKPKLLQSSDGLHLGRLTVPRLLIRLGNADACGSTPWGGSMTGINALREFLQDRGHLQREYVSPIFFKQQDPAKVYARITEWVANEITDITDFSHS